MAYLLSLIVNGVTRLQNDTHGTNIYADKHIKNNSNDNYILLGGGGHIDKGTFALANHGVHWEGFTKRATSSASTWGTLISASGYTPLFWLDSTTGGGVAFSDKGGQTFMQIDGYFYQNEGRYRLTDVTETVTALSTSGNYLTWTRNGTTSNITVPYATNAAYASSAGNADTLDSIDSAGFLRQVVVPNNTENDFNTFSNMTLTGRVDPTTGASLKNAPWSGAGPAGGYGVLTYLFNGSGYGTQMAWGYSSNRIYIRNRYWGGSGVGSLWRTSWDAIALTSEIPTVTDYYWANVKIGAQSDSSTSPTFLNVHVLKAGSAENSGLVVGGDSSKSNINTSVADQTSMIQIVAGSGGATNSSAIGFHNPGISSAVLEYKNASADLGYFNFRSDDKTWNVGIGTTSPNYKLDIVGDVRITSSDRYALEINSSIDNAIITFKGTDGSEKGQFGRGEGLYGFNYEAHRNNSKGITAFGVDDNSNFFLGTGGNPSVINSKVVVLANGNVGIGTAEPSHKLHVNGTTWIDAGSYTANRATLILNSNNAPADIIFKSLSGVNGNYGHWAISSRSGESSTRFSIFRGVENTNVKSELELFTLRPNGDLDIKGTLNLWNTTCDSNHDEGIRIHPSKHGWNALVFCGTDNNEDIGTSTKTWGLYTYNGNLYINKNSADASAANSATLCNVSNNWGIGTVSPGYNLTVSGTTYADKSLIAISGTDANKYAGNANYYHLAIGSKATSTGASILLYRADTTTQHAIVWCTGSGDHAGISVDSGSNDLGIWNNKGVLRLKKQTIIDNVEHSLQIYRTYNYHPCLNDTAGRPGISISGNYPYLWLTGGGVANTSHGATITLAAPDTAGSTNGDIKTWTFGVPGQGATWMDLAYSVNTANPHNGIANWQDGAKAKHRIMRWSTSPQNQVLIYGTGYDSAASLVVNSSRTGTWIYGASIFAPSMGKGHNVWLNVGKANSTCNSFGISWHHAGGDGSTSNYGAIEIWGKGNVQRWYGDLHTQFLGRVDVANMGYSSYNYDTAAMQIREYNYGGAQTDTWGYAPRLAWHWGGRVAAQIGLASNGYLYTAPLTGTTFYKLVYESGTWGINITGNAGYASSAGNADTVDGYHASSLWRSDGGVWNPGANITLGASANSQEWSFDITRNGYTGCYWHVWDSQLSTMLRVNADDGKVSAPYGFVGNLTGTASSVTVNNSDYNSTYRMVWHSGDNLYSTGNIYCNPSSDALYATRYYATGSAGPHFTGTSTAGNWAYLRLDNSSVLWDIATNSSSTSVGANALDFREKGADYAGIAIRYNTSSYGRLVVMNNTNTETSIGYLNTKFSSSVPIWTVGAGIGNSTSFGWWYYNVGCKMYLTTDGYVYAAAYYESSDQRLKNFHNSIDANLDKLKSIPKKYFSWKKDNENKLHIGTSAQAIRELYPELVSESEDGMLSVDYAKLSIVALKAIDVLHDEIKLLKSTNSRLEKRIQELEK